MPSPSPPSNALRGSCLRVRMGRCEDVHSEGGEGEGGIRVRLANTDALSGRTQVRGDKGGKEDFLQYMECEGVLLPANFSLEGGEDV